jgi:hypothetical protein
MTLYACTDCPRTFDHLEPNAGGLDGLPFHVHDKRPCIGRPTPTVDVPNGFEPLSDKPMLCVICKAYERYGRGVAEGTVMVDGHWRCDAHRNTRDPDARQAPARTPPAKPEKVDIREWEDEWEAKRRRKKAP